MTVPKQVLKTAPWKLRVGERRVLLFIGDLFTALSALAITLYLWGVADKFPRQFDFFEFVFRRPPSWFFFIPLFWLLLLIELYDVHRAGDWKQTLRGVATAAAVGLGFYLLLYFFYSEQNGAALPRRGVAIFIASASLLTLGWRLLYIRVFTTAQFMRRVLLVGGGKTGQVLLKIIDGLWPPPFYIAGIIDDDPKKLGTVVEGAPVLGTSEALLDHVSRLGITDIVVAISGEMHGCMFQALLDAQERGVEIARMPVVYEDLLGRVPIRLLEADWILRSFVDQTRVSSLYELGKRLVDIAGGLIGMAGLALILPFVGLAIMLDDGFPIFYAQVRSGRGGQPYQILKFRTMRRDAEADGLPKWAKEDDERATRIGRFLRKTHIDEIPQFWNVLRGDMSLVGPRAERPELVDMFQSHVPFYRARLMVKPGVTGWAQVNFGYASTIDETITKLEYDLYYIKHRSLLTDLIIMLRTPATVFGFRGR